MIHSFSSLLKHSARRLQPSPSLCLFLCLHSRGQTADSASQLPPKCLVCSRRAVGGQLHLALVAMCEFPVTGPTCQIRPSPALSCRAPGIWKVLHSDLVTSPPSFTSARWTRVFTWFISNAAAPPFRAKPCLLSVL
jgi:hypothetical protein